MTSPFLSLQEPASNGYIYLLVCENTENQKNMKIERFIPGEEVSLTFPTITDAEDHVLGLANNLGTIKLTTNATIPASLNLAINSALWKVASYGRRGSGNVILMNTRDYRNIYGGTETAYFDFTDEVQVGRWTQVASGSKNLYYSDCVPEGKIYVAYRGDHDMDCAGTLSSNDEGYWLTMHPERENVTSLARNLVQSFTFE